MQQIEQTVFTKQQVIGNLELESQASTAFSCNVGRRAYSSQVLHCYKKYLLFSI